MNLHSAAQIIFSNLPISPKTLSTYMSVYNLYIFPLLGMLPLEQIKRENIQHLIRNLPPQTAATTLSVLRTIFREVIDSTDTAKTLRLQQFAAPEYKLFQDISYH